MAHDSAQIGSPTNHTGDPDAFRGLLDARKRKNDPMKSPAPVKRVTNKVDTSGLSTTPIADLNPFFGK